MKLRQLWIPVILTIALCALLPAQAAYDGSGSFSLVTSPGDITSGGYYVFIGGGSSDKAMANVRVGSAATVGFTGLVVNASGWKVENPGTDRVWRIDSVGGNFSIYNEAAGFYIGNAGSTANGVASSAAATAAKFQWTFTAGASNRTKVVNAEFSARMLQWNNSSPRFACYSGAQSDIEIYKLDGGPVALNVVFDKSDNFSIEVGEGATITATASGGEGSYDYSWSTDMDEGDYSVSDNVFTIDGSAPAGTYSAEVEVDDGEDQVQKTIHFSITAPAPKYAISVNAGANGSATTTPATEAAAGVQVTVNASPNSGYVLDAITVTAADSSNVPVSGGKFTMPAQAVTVAVSFKEAPVLSGGLIISQYYEGASDNKWIELYNASGVAIDLAAGGYRLGSWNNANREAWKTGGTPGNSSALTGTVPAGGTHLIKNTKAALPSYATANESSAACGFNGDDSVVLYTGATYAFANVVDAFGMTANAAQDKSFVRKNTITTGVNTDFNAADWDEFTPDTVDSATTGNNEYLGYHSVSGGGPAALNVAFDKTEGFTVTEGNSAVITATATGGTAHYDYSWSSSLGAAYYSASGNQFTINATAPQGSYWAKVDVEDSDEDTVDKTINFSVVNVPLNVAILPIAEAHTVSNDWAGMTGWSGVSMSSYTDGRAQFNANNDSLTVNFDSTPDTLTFDLKGNTASTGTAPMEFLVEESSDGTNWSEVDTIDDTQVSTSYATFGPYELDAASRYVRWTFVNKYAFNLGMNNVYITKGEGGGGGAEIVVTGSLTGTVGEELVLGVELLEAVADDWELHLYGPDNEEILVGFTWDGATFTYTPGAAGTYTLEITAVDAAWDPIATKTVNLTIEEGDEPLEVEIPAIVFVAGTGFTFELPSGASLVRVEGADAVLAGQGFNWVLLNAPADYEVSGSTVTIKSSAAARRLIRIWAQ